jgi:predicted transposase/invertase (TIGR01784 family)
VDTDNKQELLNPGNDFVFKLMFGDIRNADMTSDLLAKTLMLPVKELTALTFLNTELLREHANDKKGVLDVRVKMQSGTEINVEMQNFYDKTMADRALYYWAKRFISNLAKGQTYDQLIKTVSINILHFDFFPYKKYHSIFTPREETENFVLSDLCRIDFLEILKAKDMPINPDDQLIYWLKFFSTKDREELKMIAKENPMIEKAVGILEVLSGDEKVRMEAFYREREVRDELSRIKSARQEGIEEGLEKGIERGMEQGIEKGMEKGEQKGRIKEKMEIAINMLRKNMDIDLIKDVTGLSEQEIIDLKDNKDH